MYMLVVLFLLSLPAVQSEGSVTYSTTRVCGFKGASVVLPCTYDYSWIGGYIGGEWYEETRERVRRHNPPDYNCSLKIDKLSDDHSGVYRFQFYTTLHYSWITGRPGVELSITDLQVKEEAVVGNQNQTKVTCSTFCSLDSQYVWYKNGQTLRDETTAFILLDSTKHSEAAHYSCAVRGHEGHPSPTVSLQVFIPPEAVTEGERVTLTCDTTCRLSKDPTFIWYKNGQPVTYKHTTRDNKLHLNPVSSEDAGSYSCAVSGHESLSSNDVFLNVRYRPTHVSVSISPSDGIKEGTSVTLTCSSDANPPVHTYTWYMKSGAESLVRGTGESISFNLTSDTSGLYYCEAQNELGSQNSTGVAVPSKGGLVISIAVTSGIVIAVILALMLVFVRRYTMARKRKNTTIKQETRGVLKVFLENVIRDAVTYTEHAKRKTVTAMDVVYALKRQGRTLYGFGG
ncbi:B-cell receptor CD22-like [Alosa sapidissima]|uniref:B-cell receptor CD22-like n=1 Tax=Alosa sapidissima TaxID=34773 RepID=UPI001C09B829|nr:B-cell receptor CD22-like [Alosa sapidissima]